MHTKAIQPHMQSVTSIVYCQSATNKLLNYHFVSSGTLNPILTHSPVSVKRMKFWRFGNVPVADPEILKGGQTWAYLEGPRGPPPSRRNFCSFKYSLSSFLPNHVHNLCRIAWCLWHLSYACFCQSLCLSHYSEHPTIDSSTRPHTKLTTFLTRNVKYIRQCTLPSIFKNFLFR